MAAESNDATVAFKVEEKAGDGDVVIKSPAKNRLKGTKLTPDAHNAAKKQPIFFERAASSWWNPCFDSDILENQYIKNYYNTSRRRFQVGLVYIAVACLAWVIYFGVLKLNNWPLYLGGAVACCVLAIIIFIVTLTPLYQRFFTSIAVIISIIVCSFLLLSTQTFTEANLSPVAGLTGTAEILILMYTLIPLPLFVAIIIGLVHSAIFEVLSVVSELSSLDYVAGRVLLHLCIHLIGVHIYYISQARKRSTFLKVGQSIMSRCDLAIEKQLKQRMIHSLMPPTVAEEVMKANVKEEEDMQTRRPSHGPSQGQIRFRNFHMSQMSNVSILFADIVGFTKMSSNKTAEHLVSLLNDLFGRFDVLCDQSNCEKISTLGDCYYCVSGCPTARPDHAQCCIQMGMGMCRAIVEFDSDHNEEVNMRVGVHTGDVLCGLVGTRRFKFDVFSNDVTLANMMESEGAPGRVHISECTLAFIKDQYDVEAAKEVPDIRKHKVLIEDYNTQTQQYQVRHVQEQTTLKTYFVIGKKAQAGTQSPTIPHSPQTKVASEVSGPAAAIDSVTVAIEPKSESKGAEPEISSDGQTNHVDNQDSNGVNSTLLLGQRELLATSVEDISGEKVEEVKEGDTETVLLKRITETRNASDQTDMQLVKNMRESKEVEEYLHQPPINPCTLNFVNSKFEEAYREHYRESKREGSQTLASPRISACLDMVMSLTFFVLVSIACFIAMPVKLPWIVFFAIAMLFEILMLVPILIDICVGSRNLPKIIKTFSAWLPRHIFGGFLALLPILAIFANFACRSFDEKLGSDMFLCLAVMVALLHFCNFTMLSSWIKSFLAVLGGVVLLVLILVGVCSHPITTDFNVTMTEASVTTAMMEPHHQIFDGVHPYIYEIILDVLLLVCLVVYLNRDFEINYRLSFHGDFQAQRDRKKMQMEKEQADWLLQNIIPQHVSDVLKKTSKYSCNYNDVGVVFAKISNFDEFYDESFEGGKEYLRVLNEILGDMEDLFDDPKYKDVEKIKSIGPCLMVASGLDPRTRSRNEDPNAHLYALMDFSVELLQKMDQFNAEIFNFDFELTIGYNFGDVTAGVIGTTKLLYDIWGDTVNVASRMYSTGVHGRIQITEDCARKLEDKFDFEHRGQTFVKGKGDLNTFLLVKKKDGASWK